LNAGTPAADYVAAVGKGKSALLVAPTHKECDMVTEKVREALKENRTFSDGREWNILRNLSWSPAQKSDGRCYEPGLVVKVGGHLAGFSMAEQLEVVEARRGEVIVRGENGQSRSLPLGQTEKFNVYERDEIEVCKGDQLKITVNTRSADGHDLNNSDTYGVKGFSRDGGIVLENGWRLEKDFAHVDYGYANTSHSAQSKSVDRILVAQSGLISSGATDANQFYTAVARGREREVEERESERSRGAPEPKRSRERLGTRKAMGIQSEVVWKEEIEAMAAGAEQVPKAETGRQRTAAQLGMWAVVKSEMAVEANPLVRAEEMSTAPPAKDKGRELEMEMEM
jgi:hypothetical protein